jgi:Lon protease-like protein
MTTSLPLFPLNSVLCPGVALPLHIFEERYRAMIGRCVERGEPFGVVLIRDGWEVGPLRGRLADVGTSAVIREAGRYPDGRLDIVTVGERRFRVEALDRTSEPYLVGRVTWLDEPLGTEVVAQRLASRVGTLFLRYLDLLQPTLPSEGPDIEIEVEVDVETGEALRAREPAVDEAAPAPDPGGGRGRDADLDDEERRSLLLAAARRLVAAGDPTSLSYLLTALVQVDVATRQELLEAPDTTTRLARLDTLLGREIRLLRRGLRPLLVDAGTTHARRN